METLLSFLSGIVLTSLVAIFVFRRAKRQAVENLTEKLNADYRVETAKLQADLEAAARLAEAMEQRHAQAVKAERERFDEAMEKVSAQMATATNEYLRQQQEELRKTNKESVEKLIAPLNQQMESMNKLMTDTRSANEKSTASLEGALKQMVQQTENVGKQADNLAEAMKNKGKVHGDWGEHVLEEIFEGSGLREDVEYTKQEVFPQGNRESFRPDFIINTPEGGRIIVDSKVSLTAYTDAIGADTKEEYEQFVKKNYESVWAHVMELSKKDYPKYVEGSLNYVIMFMPNEGAYVMAMNHNRSLAQEAYRKGVIILNPTNLMLALNMVLLTWHGTRQEGNCKEIIDAANKMYDKVVGLVDTSAALTKQLATVSSTCEKLNSQLHDGAGNLFKRVDDLRQMGVTSTKRPKNLVK